MEIKESDLAKIRYINRCFVQNGKIGPAIPFGLYMHAKETINLLLHRN